MLVPASFKTIPASVAGRAIRRIIHSTSSAASYNLKYADKLQQKAHEKGLGLEKLKSQAREEAQKKQKGEAASLLASFKKTNTELPHANTRSHLPESAKTSNVRKDSSPIKPLSSILNISKLLATPHTSSQVSALWTAYHASRSKGTGRGYICASLPVDSYRAMTRVAKKYPVFVVPLPRKSTSDPSIDEGAGTAHEFFFLQWDFHPAPPAPLSSGINPFEPVMPDSSHAPEPSTVLFTPLQEYKQRASFATPYMVLTLYTDLTQSHGIVLLRGEVTPSSTSAAVEPGQEYSERFLLSQVDAQLLAMELQKFYLWGNSKSDGGHDPAAEALLKQFHEEPDKFSWQDLLKSSNIVS